MNNHVIKHYIESVACHQSNKIDDHNDRKLHRIFVFWFKGKDSVHKIRKRRRADERNSVRPKRPRAEIDKENLINGQVNQRIHDANNAKCQKLFR